MSAPAPQAGAGAMADYGLGSAHALVTGAARGIGAAIARSLAAELPGGPHHTVVADISEPQEVAQAVLWLCSPGAASVTGQAISVSGGEVM